MLSLFSAYSSFNGAPSLLQARAGQPMMMVTEQPGREDFRWGPGKLPTGGSGGVAIGWQGGAGKGLGEGENVNPAIASSTELSTISHTRWCRPRGPVEPMYMPGRLRTASSPSRTVMSLAS